MDIQICSWAYCENEVRVGCDWFVPTSHHVDLAIYFAEGGARMSPEFRTILDLMQSGF